MTQRLIAPITLAAAAALTVAGLGALMTDLGSWYYGLEKPSWQPPDVAFGPVWTTIFALTAIAGVQAWLGATEKKDRQNLLIAFFMNGALNLFWSALFFRFKRPDLALYEVTLLWLSIVVLMFLCRKHSRLGSILLLPYLAWVSFAAILNYSIVQLNQPF